jgi:hypothetical protein
MIPAFLNLVLIGMLLALVFERTASLLFSIGLHAGFVFWVKSLGFITDQATSESTTLWGSDKVTDGWMTTLVLLVIFFFIDRTLPRRKVLP